MLKSNNTALVLCGHGSSFDSFKQDFKKSHKMIEKKIHTNCYFCFIEKNQPDIENCLKTIKQKGIEKVFFFHFYFLMEDILKKTLKLR